MAQEKQMPPLASLVFLLRTLYYHDQIDMEVLLSGEEYEKLPDTYVIFICDFDPLELGKYKYTLRQTLWEDESYDIISAGYYICADLRPSMARTKTIANRVHPPEAS